MRGVSQEKAHEAAPGNSTIGYHYAAALDRAGKHLDARDVLQILLQQDQPSQVRAEAEALLRALTR